jgi:hypothetical protein
MNDNINDKISNREPDKETESFKIWKVNKNKKDDEVKRIEEGGGLIVDANTHKIVDYDKYESDNRNRRYIKLLGFRIIHNKKGVKDVRELKSENVFFAYKIKEDGGLLYYYNPELDEKTISSFVDGVIGKYAKVTGSGVKCINTEVLKSVSYEMKVVRKELDKKEEEEEDE